LAQLFFRNSKFSSATIQGDNNLRKYPHNRLVNIYQSEKMAGGRLFYDATFQILGPDNESTLPPEFVVGEGFAVNIVAGFWVPMHIIGKLEIEQNKLHFRNIDDEWLQGALKSRLITVPSAQDDSGEYLLTANGKQLKVFVASLATDPKAFSEQLDLTSIPGRAPNRTP
jgi:hypothetical protein